MFIRQETLKTRTEPCEECVVADAPAECGVWLTSAAQVGPSALVCCDLPRTTPYYGELLHADVLVLVNTRKIASSQFGLVQRGGGARHLLNSVRELSDQTSCFPTTKWHIHCLLVQHITIN